MKFYKIVSLMTAAAFVYSFFQHILNSGAIIDMGLQTTIATEFIAQRMSIFPLGVAVLLLLSKNLPHSKARQNICISLAVLLLGYAGLGIYAFITRTVNSNIFIPITLEIILGVSYLLIFLINRKKKAFN